MARPGLLDGIGYASHGYAAPAYAAPAYAAPAYAAPAYAPAYAPAITSHAIAAPAIAHTAYAAPVVKAVSITDMGCKARIRSDELLFLKREKSLESVKYIPK